MLFQVWLKWAYCIVISKFNNVERKKAFQINILPIFEADNLQSMSYNVCVSVQSLNLNFSRNPGRKFIKKTILNDLIAPEAQNAAWDK